MYQSKLLDKHLPITGCAEQSCNLSTQQMLPFKLSMLTHSVEKSKNRHASQTTSSFVSRYSRVIWHVNMHTAPEVGIPVLMLMMKPADRTKFQVGNCSYDGTSRWGGSRSEMIDSQCFSTLGSGAPSGRF